MTEVERIAKGLTKAQREALATLSRQLLHAKASGAALMALTRKGLARNGWSNFNGNLWRATQLGLSVRDHLMKEVK